MVYAICVQKQLKYHALACQAAMRALEPGKSRREILAAMVETKRWYRMHQKYGGNAPLVWSQSSDPQIGNPCSSSI
jgi:hypothetical protein